MQTPCCQTSGFNLSSTLNGEAHINIMNTQKGTLCNLTGVDLLNSTSCSCFRWNETESGHNETGNVRTVLSPPTYVYIYMTVACALIFVAGVLGNLLVIYVVVRLRSMRTRMNLHLVSLSVADLMVLMVCPPVALLELYGKERWFLGAFMCKLIPYLENTAVHSSGLCLLAISQERYMAICRPLSVVRRRHNGLPTICLTWLLSLLPCLPFIFISELNQVPYYDNTLQPMCQTSTSLKLVKVFFVVDFVLCLVLPLLASTFFYTCILCAMAPLSCCQAQNLPALQTRSGGAEHETLTRSRGKVVKMMVTVMALFYACLLPMRSLAISVIFLPWESLQNLGFENYLNLINVPRLLMYLNSAVNPVIYGLMSSKFRNAFARVLPIPSALQLQGNGKSQNRTPRSTKTSRSSREVFSMIGTTNGRKDQV